MSTTIIQRRLKTNEDAPVIREMFEMYLAGMSTTEIEHEFNKPPKKLLIIK